MTTPRILMRSSTLGRVGDKNMQGEKHAGETDLSDCFLVVFRLHQVVVPAAEGERWMRAALPRLDGINNHALLADAVLNVVQPHVERVACRPQPVALPHFLNDFLSSMLLLDDLPPSPPPLHHCAFLPQPDGRRDEQERKQMLLRALRTSWRALFSSAARTKLK